MVLYSNLLKKFTFKCFHTKSKKHYRLPQGDFNRAKRVFRDDFKSGGRIYFSFQPKIKKDDRKNITINGYKVCELDYINNHLKILYHSMFKFFSP